MGSIAGGIVSGIGGILGSRSAEKAARASANAQMEAARTAAEESRFRPIGVTNAFGSSSFTTDPTTGRVSGASYNVNPQLAAIRDQLLGLAGGTNVAGATNALQQAQQGMFGNIAGAGDIMGSTQRLFTQRQNLLAPQRERDLSTLRNVNFQTGRSGLAVGGTSAGGYAAANPEMQAFFNAQRQQDDSLLAQSEQDARRYRADDLSTFGGLFNLQGQALSPLMSLLQGAQGVEGVGRSAYEDSLRLGQLSQNAAGGNALLQGGMAAAQSNLNAANIKNAGMQGLFGLAGNVLGGLPNIFGGVNNLFGGTKGYLPTGTGYTDPNSLFNIGGRP